VQRVTARSIVMTTSISGSDVLALCTFRAYTRRGRRKPRVFVLGFPFSFALIGRSLTTYASRE